MRASTEWQVLTNHLQFLTYFNISMPRSDPVASAPSVPDFISRQVTQARYLFLDAPRHDATRSKAQGPRVVCGGYEACDPGYRVHRTAFRYHSIEHVLHGHGRLVLNGRAHELCPGLTYSYGPRCPHQIEADQADPPRKYFIDFTGRSAAAMLRAAALPSGTARRLVPGGQFAEIMELLIRQGARPGPETDRICSALLQALAGTIAQAPSQADQADSDVRARQTYLQCRELLDRHFLNLTSLGELADRCGLAPAYLCRLFQRFDTDTPYQALIRHRMNHAAAALTRSNHMVKQVAHELGYTDAYQFSRAFKRIHGVSPAAFKAREASTPAD